MRHALSVNAPKHAMITPLHAQQLLLARRTEVTALGCYLSNSVDETGRTVLNLENSKSTIPGQTDREIGLKMAYAYHLSLIADGRMDSLLWVTKGTGFEVSHLCHNKGCFAPQHLIVEEKARNQARNSCMGHEIIQFQSMRYHPCAHGGRDGKQFHKCVLPTKKFENGGSYVNENEL